MAASKSLQADWAGSSGELWYVNRARLDRMLLPLGRVAIAEADVKPGEAILDIGCGPGTTCFTLAQQAGDSGEVTGIDISPQLLEAANSDPRKSSNVHFLLGDAATAALPSAHFDLLFSRFGVMFFDDPIAAFTHLRTALKPDGRLVFLCWRSVPENEWTRLPFSASRHILDFPETHPLLPGPFAFADPDHVRTILASAGFSRIAVSPFDDDVTFGEGATHIEAIDDAVDHLCGLGMLARAMSTQPEETQAAIRNAVRAALSEKPPTPFVRLGAATWIVTAHNTD